MMGPYYFWQGRRLRVIWTYPYRLALTDSLSFCPCGVEGTWRLQIRFQPKCKIHSHSTIHHVYIYTYVFSWPALHVFHTIYPTVTSFPPQQTSFANLPDPLYFACIPVLYRIPFWKKKKDYVWPQLFVPCRLLYRARITFPVTSRSPQWEKFQKLLSASCLRGLHRHRGRDQWGELQTCIWRMYGLWRMYFVLIRFYHGNKNCR